MYVCMQTCRPTHYVYVCMCACIYMFIYMYACMYMCMYVLKYMHECFCVCVCVCVCVPSVFDAHVPSNWLDYSSPVRVIPCSTVTVVGSSCQFLICWNLFQAAWRYLGASEASVVSHYT